MKRSHLTLLRQLASNSPSRCHHCQLRFLQTSRALRNENNVTPIAGKEKTLQAIQQQIPEGRNPDQPSHYIPKVGLTNRDPEWRPSVLGRPIGWPKPPHPADNLDLDTRTAEQKRKDFVNYDKHLEKRQKMVKQFARPYFRDYTYMKYAKGKMWVANTRLWKKEVSLWMPNVWGRDWEGEAQPSVGICQGKVTVVCFVSRQWAADQVRTFVDEEALGMVKGSNGLAQVLDIVVEEAGLFRMVLWLYRERIRRNYDGRFQKYLMMKGMKDGIRDVLGMMNHKTGYVYLVDSDCRIRWAGSGDATAEEKAAFKTGLQRLISEKAGVKMGKKPGTVVWEPDAPEEKEAAVA